MKVVAISGAIIGKKTLTAMKYVAEKMNKEGDSISAMFDGESPSSYVRWDENDNT